MKNNDFKPRPKNRGIGYWSGCDPFHNPELAPFQEALENLRKVMDKLGGNLVVSAVFSKSEVFIVVDGNTGEPGEVINFVLDELAKRNKRSG